MLLSSLLKVNAVSSFNDTVNENYEYYRSCINETTDSYSLSVYEGIYKGDVRLAINYIPNTNYSYYKLMVYMNDNYYYLKSSKNVINLPVVSFEQDFTLVVIDTYKNQIINNYDVTISNASDIKSASDVIKGLNNPSAKVVKPSLNSTFTTITSYIWIIGLALLGFFFSFISYKKSTASFLYKPQKDSSNFDFKAFLAADDASFPPVKGDEIKTENDLSAQEKTEEIVESIDAINYLKEKGYPIDSDMNDVAEDVKNQMMMTLMSLKDNKQISKEEYLKVVMMIWKKSV